MIEFVTFDGEGRILQSGRVIESMLPLQADESVGRGVLAGSGDPNLHRVVDGVIVDRPLLPIEVSSTSVLANGADEVVISGVPAGAELKIVGPLRATGTADGEEVHLTFARPGTYDIVCKIFPYQDWKVTINAI